MSLRDQLLAKGIASKKDAAKIDREAKAKRKAEQGNRDRKRIVEAERLAAEAREREERLLKRAQQRKAAELEREAHERLWRARRMIQDSTVRSKGPLKFHFRCFDRVHIDFLRVSFRAASALRSGQAAIAALRSTAVPDLVDDYVLIPAGKVERLLAVDPDVVVFHVTDTKGISEPDEQFLEPDWEISLVPHRVWEG